MVIQCSIDESTIPLFTKALLIQKAVTRTAFQKMIVRIQLRATAIDNRCDILLTGTLCSPCRL